MCKWIKINEQFLNTSFSILSKVEDRKDSDDEKSDRNRPWWKKRFVSAIPKGTDSHPLLFSGFLLFFIFNVKKLVCELVLFGKRSLLSSSFPHRFQEPLIYSVFSELISHQRGISCVDGWAAALPIVLSASS